MISIFDETTDPSKLKSAALEFDSKFKGGHMLVGVPNFCDLY